MGDLCWFSPADYGGVNSLVKGPLAMRQMIRRADLGSFLRFRGGIDGLFSPSFGCLWWRWDRCPAGAIWEGDPLASVTAGGTDEAIWAISLAQVLLLISRGIGEPSRCTNSGRDSGRVTPTFSQRFGVIGGGFRL